MTHNHLSQSSYEDAPDQRTLEATASAQALVGELRAALAHPGSRVREDNYDVVDEEDWAYLDEEPPVPEDDDDPVASTDYSISVPNDAGDYVTVMTCMVENFAPPRTVEGEAPRITAQELTLIRGADDDDTDVYTDMTELRLDCASGEVTISHNAWGIDVTDWMPASELNRLLVDLTTRAQTEQ